jgi:hypothetical protein
MLGQPSNEPPSHDIEARRGNLKYRSTSERVEQKLRAEGLVVCAHFFSLYTLLWSDPKIEDSYRA